MFVVRQAQERDLKKTIDLRLELVKSFPHAYLSTRQELEKQALPEWEGWFFQYFRSNNSNFWIAEDKDQLIGMVACKGTSWKRSAHMGTVIGLGVLPSHKKKGVGQALMEKLIVWAKKKASIHRLQLDVYTDNKEAVSLYQKLGFKKEGVKKKYAQKKDGIYQDSLAMVLFL